MGTAYRCFRAIKLFIFFIVAIYSIAALWLAFISIQEGQEVFSLELPALRCLSFFSDTKSWADKETNTTAAFAVGIGNGRLRIAICTDKNETELDKKFIDEEDAILYDPLEEATKHKCSLRDESKAMSRLAQCVISPTSSDAATQNCSNIINTSPYPMGAAWSYTISKTDCDTFSNWHSCCAEYEKNDELTALRSSSSGGGGGCPYRTVRFYEIKKQLVQVLFLIGAIIPVWWWVWEVNDIRVFCNQFGDYHGDMSWLACANDGSLGGCYLFLHMLSGGKAIGRIPFPTLVQSARGFAVSGFTTLVAAVGMWGCSWTSNPILFCLFVVSSMKVLYHCYRLLWGMFCLSAPTAKKQKKRQEEGEVEGGKKEEHLGVIVPSSGGANDDNENAIDDAVNEEKNEEYGVIPLDMQVFDDAKKEVEICRIEQRQEKVWEHWKAIFKRWSASDCPHQDSPCYPMFICFFQSVVMTESGWGLQFSIMNKHFAKEYARLTTIIHRPTTDPGIRSFCITWRDIVIEMGKMTRQDDISSSKAVMSRKRSMAPIPAATKKTLTQHITRGGGGEIQDPHDGMKDNHSIVSNPFIVTSMKQLVDETNKPTHDQEYVHIAELDLELHGEGKASKESSPEGKEFSNKQRTTTITTKKVPLHPLDVPFWEMQPRKEVDMKKSVRKLMHDSEMEVVRRIEGMVVEDIEDHQ